MSGAAGGAVAAAVIAAEVKRKREEEEEKMTNYNNDDLEGWEFKIVRSNTGQFKNRETIKKIADEEAQSGWELVEKFDNSRLRFKRKTSHRAQDTHRQIDPYRTETGMSGGAVGLAIVGGILLTIGVVLALVFIFK